MASFTEMVHWRMEASNQLIPDCLIGCRGYVGKSPNSRPNILLTYSLTLSNLTFAGMPVKNELVQIAERLGANKDMFRTDIFVGRPTSADPDSPLQIAVSESEIFPTTVFISDRLSREAARLWVAGYVLGIYELIENSEVPPEFAARGKLSDINEYRDE